MTKRSIVVLGDVNVDILMRLPDRAREGSLAAVPEPELFGGGTGGNTSVALARLGLPVAFVGMIGDDLYGRDVRAGLEAEGVDLSGLCVTSEYPTATVIAIVQPDGDRVVVVWPPRGGAHTRLRPKTSIRGRSSRRRGCTRPACAWINGPSPMRCCAGCASRATPGCRCRST